MSLAETERKSHSRAVASNSDEMMQLVFGVLRRCL